MMQAEKQHVPPSSPSPSFWSRWQAAVREFSDWVQAFIQDPVATVQRLPQQGTWEKPLLWATTAGLASGLLQVIYMPGLSLGMLVSAPLAAIVSAFLFAGLIHFLLSAFAKATSFYRCVYFTSLLSFVSPATFLLSSLHPILGVAGLFAVLYPVHLFAMTFGQMSKRSAAILVIALGVLAILASFAMVATSLGRMY